MSIPDEVHREDVRPALDTDSDPADHRLRHEIPALRLAELLGREPVRHPSIVRRTTTGSPATSGLTTRANDRDR